MSTFDLFMTAQRSFLDGVDAQLIVVSNERDAALRDAAELRDRLERAGEEHAVDEARIAELEAAVADLEQQIRDHVCEGAEEPEFELGVTIPMSTTIGDLITNVGTLDGVARGRYAGPVDIVGSTDPDRPTLIQHANIDRIVRVISGYVDFFNCSFSGSGAAFDSGLLDCRAKDVKRVSVTRCDFDPGEAGASQWLSGAIGHHMTLQCNRFRRVVDYLQSYNTHGPEVDNHFLGNLGEWHAYFYADRAGVVHPSDVRTHNDGIQHQGGRGLEVRGNRLIGKVFLPNGVDLPPDQGTAPYRHLAGQGVMIQQNVQTSTPIDPIVVDNWIEGYWHPVVSRTREASKGGGAAYDLVFAGNETDDDNRYYATSSPDLYGVPGGKPYSLRVDAAVTVNGVSYPTDGASRALGEGNVYSSSERVEARRRGRALTVRRDAFTGGGA